MVYAHPAVMICLVALALYVLRLGNSLLAVLALSQVYSGYGILKDRVW